MNQENLKVEYKSEYATDIKKTVVAFANTFVRKIYIGISDSGETIGLENPDSVMLQVANTVRDSIKPDITLFSDCSGDLINGKNIVVSPKIVTNRFRGYVNKLSFLKMNGLPTKLGGECQH